MEEDNFFSDDDLDDIPVNTLQALEDHAISFTQRPPSSTNQVAQLIRKQAHNASSLNKASNANRNVPYRPPSTRPPQDRLGQNDGPPPGVPQPPSSDYGFDAEDVVDLDEPSMVMRDASGSGQTHFSALRREHARHVSKPTPDSETAAAFAAADADMDSHTLEGWPASPDHTNRHTAALDVSAMQARIAELEREQARLRASEQEARTAAESRRGEIAIIRSNLQKTTKTYEDRLTVMQRLHAQETAKQKAELEMGRKEREKMQTDNRFLQHEAAQEAERAKRVAGPRQIRSGLAHRETPRKDRRGAFGDGFDDDEVQYASPSRSKDKSRDHTPKAGAKRKRPAHDSPIALALVPPPHLVRQESSGQTLTSFDAAASSTPMTSRENEDYEFMQMLMNHRPNPTERRSVEFLTDYQFPSETSTTVSATFWDKFTSMSGEKSVSFRVAESLLKLWSICLQDKHFAPFFYILDLLTCAVESQLLSFRAQLIETALPLCTKTINLVAFDVARASTNRSFAASLDRDKLEKLAEEAAVDDVFDFMKTLCDAATLSPQRLEVFWRTLEWDPLMIMLNKAQPLNQIVTSLQMLATSALSTTFGPINADPDLQATQEKNTIDKLTNLLFEVPELPKDEQPYTEGELNQLRVHVLYVFREMCQTSHGSLLLAQHRSFFGRVVRFLHAQVCKLYALRPDIGRAPPVPPSPTSNSANSDGDNTYAVPAPGAQPDNTARGLTIESISLSVHLLHHLLRAHDATIRVEEKLRVVAGGYHKFLVGLTRVAFAEPAAATFERGLPDAVADAAHAVLDHVLGPEDGEAVMRAVETPRGSNVRGEDGRAVGLGGAVSQEASHGEDEFG